jgi:hypothetical protein
MMKLNVRYLPANYSQTHVSVNTLFARKCLTACLERSRPANPYCCFSSKLLDKFLVRLVLVGTALQVTGQSLFPRDLQNPTGVALVKQLFALHVILCCVTWGRAVESIFWRLLLVSRNVSLGITTRYVLDGPRIESRKRQGSSHPSRFTFVPIFPAVQRVPKLFPEVKTAEVWL